MVFAENFHVFEIERNEREITWLVDGESYNAVDITDKTMNEFHGKQDILLNIAVGGTYAGRPDETTPFPSQMCVDWGRVYQEK
ncbi:family 16 glycosylhydrolase [Mariniblastus sp.]|nr:family 16 glycosylhydrolase [Mariniblastus sp.]